MSLREKLRRFKKFLDTPVGGGRPQGPTKPFPPPQQPAQGGGIRIPINGQQPTQPGQTKQPTGHIFPGGNPHRNTSRRQPTKKPVKTKSPLNNVAGQGFQNFANGLMLNDGKGNLKDRNDWLETIPTKSGQHIPAYVLRVPYEEWIRNFESDCTMDPDFMHWLFFEFVPREEGKERHYPGQYVSRDLSRREMLQVITSQRVRYLNSIERQSKIIRVSRDGYLINSLGHYYHTSNESTMHSGVGWAIFVVDRKDQIYAGSHISGHFHHSSFLAGDFVSAAGEIAVYNGQIVAITCKSGHYRPGIQNMVNFLKILYRQGVNLRNLPVMVEWNPNSQPRFFNAYDLLVSKGRAGKLLPAPPRPPVW